MIVKVGQLIQGSETVAGLETIGVNDAYEGGILKLVGDVLVNNLRGP